MSKRRKGADRTADIVKEAWEIVTSMETDIEDARIFAMGVAILAAEAIHDDEQLGSVFARLGVQIANHCKAVEERRGELWQLLHPNRATLEKEGRPGEAQR
jgi:hypothetical protein